MPWFGNHSGHDRNSAREKWSLSSWGDPVIGGSRMNGRLRVRVPASSANLGPGFDVFGMALTLWAEVGITGSEPTDGSDSIVGHIDEHKDQDVVGEQHPAMVAFRAAGGRGGLDVRCPIPSGRGLGFSGAVRVAGVCLGLAESAGIASHELEDFIDGRRREILSRAAELEGHGDNVAASLFGGVTAAVPRGTPNFDVVRVPVSPRLSEECTIVVWVPSFQTSTVKSRGSLSPTVSREDAVFNIAQAVRLSVAFMTGDRRGLDAAREDRLHQGQRLADAPLSLRALDTMIDAGALTGWLSGSGPTVAAMCATESLPAIETALAGDPGLADSGRVLRLGIDTRGLQAAR